MTLAMTNFKSSLVVGKGRGCNMFPFLLKKEKRYIYLVEVLGLSCGLCTLYSIYVYMCVCKLPTLEMILIVNHNV